ncbi:CoB--CoM heterodisulfide reductase iron-sulfur subunit A family protein [Archaeoglobus neptunius]|uniref:CoB--CoM heterodisulfide reductase iron-sulfur subunit A family protein n=1 Tax=Archaeoglobus neptunius TaxID=2798580 RepID=UPI0019279C04|nr:CoB--CoM heterodisulfide reductase iron-sulfur subunit A family protein [Archaeoglobus neptunius]
MRDRIGVYICHCGGNISDVVDVERVAEAVGKIPEVVVARTYVFMCSDPGQKLIEEDIRKYDLNGIVVASCSPHLHEKTFRSAVSRGGMNPYVYEQVNIREHVSWVHKHSPEEATEKAIRLVKAGVAKVSLARELSEIRLDVKPTALVIGAGLAGMRAAVDLAKMGVDVHLVEKEHFVGGWIAKGYKAYPEGKPGSEVIRELIEEMKSGKIRLLTGAEVLSVTGSVGNFQVRIKVRPRFVVGECDRFEEAMEKCPVEVDDEFNEGLRKRKAIYQIPTYPELPAIDIASCNRCGECVKVCGEAIDLNQQSEVVDIEASMIIMATGFKPYTPKEGEFGFGRKGIITLPQFERLLALSNGKLTYDGREVRDVAFIYCVGSRNDEHEYCSRYCCTATINAALAAKELGIRSYHIYRDIRTYGKYETYYEDAGKNRMLFFRFTPDSPPEVRTEGEKLLVKVRDQLTFGEEVEIPVDLVVLVTGMELAESEIYGMLKIPFSRDGFLQEVHPKLRPVETAIGGVLIAGTCQSPKDVMETSASASAAAAKAATYLLKGYTELEPFIAEIDAEKCNACEDCVAECPSGAISMSEIGGSKVAVVNGALCRGCGACAGICPVEAINLRGYYYDQLRKMIDALLEV